MGTHLSVKTLHSLLQKCIGKRDLVAGREVQRLIAQSGFQSNPFLGSHLIRMFALCGNLYEAKQVFNKLDPPTIFAWSTIILAHANLGECEHAIRLFYQMQHCNLCPNSYTFVAVLKACASISCLDQGMLIHAQVITRDCELDLFVANTLIDMYAKCGSLEDARRVFDNSSDRSVATWSAMIAGYSLHEHGEEALQLFHLMKDKGMTPNDVTFLCTLKACGSVASLDKGKLIHDHIRRSGYASDVAVGNSLICMYVKCGSLDDARRVFDDLPKQNVVTWNAMVSGYGQHGYGHEALQLFERMQEEGVNPNTVTFASILKASSNISALEEGRMIHTKFIMYGAKWDAFMESTLIDMYIQCGSLKDARGIFDNLPERELVTWSAMVSGLVHHARGVEALALFNQMQQEGIEPNDITFVSILKACSNIGAIDQGKLIHMSIIAGGFESNEYVGNALIDMYAKSGSVEDARIVFAKLPKKDVIAWNAIIFGYAEHGLDEEALQLFQRMQEEGKQSTTVTFVSALRACSNVTILEWGRLVNCHIVEGGCESNVIVGNTLIDMYARCESLNDAVMVFASLPHRNEFTWSAIIVGCAQCSNYNLALKYFATMQQEGFNLNEVLFVCLLSACSHVGLVDEAFHYFNLMEQKYGIAPALDHYYCVVDLLGRIGCLNEAEDLLQTIPFKTNPMGWSSLLSHCKTYGNVEIGSRCFDSFVLLDHRHASGYVLMSNVYMDANMWEDVGKVQGLKASAHAWKKPGKALIKIRSHIYEFCVADENNLWNDDIYSMLKRLCVRLRDKAYMPQLVDFSMHPFSIEEDLIGNGQSYGISYQGSG